MSKSYYKFLVPVIFAWIMALPGCEPDREAFDRPDWLAGTVYQVLESKGNFTSYLKCLDRTPYGKILARSGSWTLFAPNDSAFARYLKEKNYASVGDMPYEEVLSIVKYSIAPEAWNTTNMTYFSAAWTNPGAAFRRKTAYSDSLKIVDAADIPTMENWRDKKYIVETPGTKTISYFLDPYMTAHTLTTTDYDFIFSGNTRKAGDFEVMGANVINRDIVAENGYIHETDKVLVPASNLYTNITAGVNKDKYSTFRRLLERFIQITPNLTSTLNYQNRTGSQDSIYRLGFRWDNAAAENRGYLTFDPTDEDYNLGAAVSYKFQAYGYGLIAPDNDAFAAYLNDPIFSKYYKSFDNIPNDLALILLNNHFIPHYTMLVPSQITSLTNNDAEPIDFQLSSAEDVKMCSNGLFVGSKKVAVPRLLSTVVAPLFLDTAYSIMKYGIKYLDLARTLSSPNSSFTIFGIRNDQFKNVPDPNAFGKFLNISIDNKTQVIKLQVIGGMTYYSNSASAGDVAYIQDELKAIVLNQIAEGRVSENGTNYYKLRNGEYVKVSNMTVQGGGDIESNTSLTPIVTVSSQNGSFYGLTAPINRKTKTVYKTLAGNPNFSKFLKVLSASKSLMLYTAAPAADKDSLVSFLESQDYTLFAPSNAAVDQAVADGVIPDPASLSGMDPVALANARKKLQDFAKRHFMQLSIYTNGLISGTYKTMEVTDIIDYVPVYTQYAIQNVPGANQIILKDPGTNAEIARTASDDINIITSLIAVHKIDHYLK